MRNIFVASVSIVTPLGIVLVFSVDQPNNFRTYYLNCHRFLFAEIGQYPRFLNNGVFITVSLGTNVANIWTLGLRSLYFEKLFLDETFNSKNGGKLLDAAMYAFKSHVGQAVPIGSLYCDDDGGLSYNIAEQYVQQARV